MKVSGVTADMVREFKPGYRLGRGANGSGHAVVIDADGNPARDEQGRPVALALSPSGGGPHYKKRIRARLVEAGVIAKNAEEELVEKVKDRPPLLSDLEEQLADLPSFMVEETFFGPHYRELLPSVVANVSWEEYLAMEQCAGLILERGERAVKQMTPFLQMVQRTRKLMERQVELKKLAGGAQIPSGAANGVYA